MSNKLYCIVCNDGNSCYCELDEMIYETPNMPVSNIIYNTPVSNIIYNIPSNIQPNMTHIINQFNNITINNS